MTKAGYIKAPLSVVVIAVWTIVGTSIAQDKSFASKFHLERTITIDSTILIANVSALSVDDEGRLLVADQFENKAYLFDSTGTLLKQVIPNAVTPAPIRGLGPGRFRSDGSFLVCAGYTGTFRFSRAGDCIGVIDSPFFPTRQFCTDRLGNIYALYHEEKLGPCVKCDSSGMELRRFSSIPRDFAGLVGRVLGGGIACDDEGNIYVCYPTSDEILKYDSTLKQVGTFRHDSKLYEQPERMPDHIRGDRKSIMAAVEPRIKGKSVVTSLDLAAKNTLALQFYTGSQVCVQLFDLSGHYIPKEEITSPAAFAAFHNGRAYMVREDGRKRLIEVYRIE
jgi:hypothetical protein